MNELVFLDPDDLNEIPFTKSDHGKGHVYIIEADDRIKIGRTTNISKRVNALRTQSGRNFKRICFTQQCKNYMEIESAMHRFFKEHRTVGEWFRTSFDLAADKLESFELDHSDVPEKEFYSFKLLDAFDEAFKRSELNKLLDENPVFKNYLERNGFRLYFCDRANQIVVTDDEDVDMSLDLFLAIYRSNAV